MPAASVPGDRQVATYVPTEMAEAIDAAAQEDGLSRAAFVRTSIAKLLAARAATRTTVGGEL